MRFILLLVILLLSINCSYALKMELSMFKTPEKINLKEKNQLQNLGYIELEDFILKFPYLNSYKHIEDIKVDYSKIKVNPNTQINLLKLDDLYIFLTIDADYQQCKICRKLNYDNEVLSEIFNMTPEIFISKSGEIDFDNYDDIQVSLLLKKGSFLPLNSSVIYKLRLDEIDVFLIGGSESLDTHIVFSINNKVIKLLFKNYVLDDSFISFIFNWKIVKK